MPIEDIMTKRLIAVEPTDTIDRLKQIIDKTHVHHILVVKEGELLGIISDRDVLKQLSPFLGTAFATSRDESIMLKSAMEIMTPKPITTTVGASIREAGKLILDNKISLLPVMNESDVLVGVVSWKDVLRFAIE